MRSIFFLFFWLMGSMGVEAIAKSGHDATHMMWHLVPSEGASLEQAATVEKTIRSFLKKQRQKSLLDVMHMDSLLLVEGNEKYLRCGIGPVCLSELGKLAGVGFVVAGQVSRSQKTTQLHLVVVSTANGKIVSSWAMADFSGRDTQQMQELDLAIFEPEKYKGTLQLSCPIEGAQVFLDQQQVGITPLREPLVVQAGERLLEIEKPGHQRFSKKIRIPLGDTRHVVALLPDLHSKAEPPTLYHKHWSFWTLAGVSLVSTATAIGFHAKAINDQEDADRFKDLGLNKWRDKEADATSSYRASYVLYGIGAASGLAVGVLLFLDLTRGEITPEKSSATNRPVNVAMAIGSDAFGLSLDFSF